MEKAQNRLWEKWMPLLPVIQKTTKNIFYILRCFLF
jgi:hypothetical protein